MSRYRQMRYESATAYVQTFSQDGAYPRPLQKPPADSVVYRNVPVTSVRPTRVVLQTTPHGHIMPEPTPITQLLFVPALASQKHTKCATPLLSAKSTAHVSRKLFLFLKVFAVLNECNQEGYDGTKRPCRINPRPITQACAERECVWRCVTPRGVSFSTYLTFAIPNRPSRGVFP